MLPKLGILAGGGELPARLIEHCRAIDRPFFVVALAGHCDPATVNGAPHQWLRIGEAGAILDTLRAHSARDVVLIGRIHRPRIRDLRPDRGGWMILARIWRNFFSGDDKLLRSVAAVFEGEGFRVVGVHEVMDRMLAPRGAFGRHTPDNAGHRDIELGLAAARELGARDVGQAVLVRNGTVVDQEDAAGTDAMLRRAAQSGERGGVLVKARKPQQDTRLDLPSIGPQTVRNAALAHLSGIAVEAENTIVVDFADVARAADAEGLFIVGVGSDDG